MDIQTLGAWGELLGGIGGLVAAIAVVGSLIFVGVQVKASVRQSSVDSYTAITTLWTNFTNATAANDEAWRIFYSGIRDYDALPPMEKSRFNFLIGMYFGIHDTVIVHQDLGVFKNTATHDRNMEELYAIFQMPGVQSWWKKRRGRVFAPKAEAYLIARMESEGLVEPSLPPDTD
jgi:hypothetical protein